MDRDRHPYPLAVAGLLPAGLVDVLDGSVGHLLGQRLARGRQGVGHLLPQADQGAQGDLEAEHGVADVLQAAQADVLPGGQQGKRGDQARADGLGAEIGGDGFPGDVGAAGAAATVALVLGDDDGLLGKLDDLVPDRLRVAWAGLGAEVVAATGAGLGDEGDDLGDHAGGQALAGVALVAWLSAGLASGGLLLGSGRGGGRVGGGGLVGVGGVLGETRLDLGEEGLELLDALPLCREQGGDGLARPRGCATRWLQGVAGWPSCPLSCGSGGRAASVCAFTPPERLPDAFAEEGVVARMGASSIASHSPCSQTAPRP